MRGREDQSSRSSDAHPGRALGGILVAALLYVPMISLCLIIIGLLLGEINGVTELAFALVIAIAAVIWSFPLAALVLVPTALLALGVTSLVIYTIHVDSPWPIVAGAAGGLTGFLLTSYTFVSLEYERPTFWMVLILLGPGLATMMGQFGAAWATVPVHYTPVEVVPENTESEAIFRFDIRQLMITTAWLAGILTLLKLTNILGPWSAGIVAAWFLFQAATLWVILRLVRKVRGNA